jgi:hypothetical protein
MVLDHEKVLDRISQLETQYHHRFESIEQALDFLIDQKAAEALQENRRRIGFGQ